MQTQLVNWLLQLAVPPSTYNGKLPTFPRIRNRRIILDIELIIEKLKEDKHFAASIQLNLTTHSVWKSHKKSHHQWVAVSHVAHDISTSLSLHNHR